MKKFEPRKYKQTFKNTHKEVRVRRILFADIFEHLGEQQPVLGDPLYRFQQVRIQIQGMAKLLLYRLQCMDKKQNK